MPDTDLLQPVLDVGGPLALIVAVFVALMRGWLWTGRQVDQVLAVKDQVIADKQQQVVDWREAYRAEAARGDVLAHGQEKVLGALRQLSGTGGG